MKYKIMLLLFTCVFVLFTSCKTDKKEQSECIVSLKETIKEEIDVANCFDLVDWLPLETGKDCLLGYVNKIEAFNGDYYILDVSQRHNITVFDSQGKYLRSIGVMGHGHGEYPSISDFTIDRERGRVVVLSGPSKVFVYDLNGAFLYDKEICESLLWNIVGYKGGFICSSNHYTYTEGEHAYLLYRFNESFDMLDKQVNVLPEQMYFPMPVSSLLQRLDGYVYYVDCYTNRLYKIGEQPGDMTVMRLELKHPMPYECYTSQDKFMENQQTYDFLTDVYVGSNGIIVSYIQDLKPQLAIVGLDGKVLANGMNSTHVSRMFSGENGEILCPVSAEEYLQSYQSHCSLPVSDSVSAGNNYLIAKLKLRIDNVSD